MWLLPSGLLGARWVAPPVIPVPVAGAHPDASNARTRLKTAAFPVVKTLDEFDRAVSSIPPATLDYLASLEWITAKENLCLVGPAGTLGDDDVGVVQEPVDGGGGQRLGHDLVEAGRVQVRADRPGSVSRRRRRRGGRSLRRRRARRAAGRCRRR